MASPLRIGYINVRGLSPLKWEACCRLVDTVYDFLFVAETWFVDHKTYTRDRRFIFSTPKPPCSGKTGRVSGGVYLLGTRRARSIVTCTPKTTTFSITFTLSSGLSISGVYFPPSTMSDSEVEC